MSSETEDAPSSPEIHFEPIVKLPLVEIKTMEEDEEELIKLRAKLYRFDNTEQPPEWKERGTGKVKILKDHQKGTSRIVMRREKTLKICANHYILPYMNLNPAADSDRAWLWSTAADYADEEVKAELFAMKFQNAECAQKFKAAFEAAKQHAALQTTKEPEEKDVSEKLEAMKLKDKEEEKSEEPASPEKGDTLDKEEDGTKDP